MDAIRLLASVADAYASLSSYVDEGVVVVPVVIPGLSSVAKTQFSTAIVTPGLFRFKFEAPHPYPPLSHIITRSVCGLHGSIAYNWTKFHGKASELRIATSLSMAVAGATGVSMGSVGTIAELMLPALGAGWNPGLKNVSLGEDEDLEGSRCHVLRAQFPIAHARTYWIDHTTLTIRKVTNSGLFSSEEVRRNIRLNEPINAQIFELPKSEA